MYAEQKSKQCKTCGEVKILNDYYFTKKGYYQGTCKKCIGNKSKRYYFEHADELNKARQAYQKKYRAENKDKEREWCREWKSKNLEKKRQIDRESYHRQPKKRLANGRLYFARKLKRTPRWLNKQQRKQMMEIYCNCPEGYHVDHIIPLKGKEVSGLHVPWNLQYLPAKENMRKNNRVA